MEPPNLPDIGGCNPSPMDRKYRSQNHNTSFQRTGSRSRPTIAVNYAEKGNGNYLMIVDSLMGYIQAYRAPKKSTEDAIKYLPSWVSIWGMSN